MNKEKNSGKTNNGKNPTTGGLKMPIELEKPKKKASIKKVLTSILPSEPKPYIEIDYPTNGEKLYARHYAVRIGAGWGTNVEISIDSGDFKPCRHAGYFWYDWHGISKGKHKLTAQMKTSDGKIKKSKIVNCEAI